MKSNVRRMVIELSLLATVVGTGALAGVRVAENNGILIVPGQDKEAEEKILVIPGQAHGGSAGGSAQGSHGTSVGHAASGSAPARHDATPPSANRQEQLERPGARQTGTERGDGRQQNIELPEGRGTRY